MPNICTNRVVVVGPTEAVSSFLEAAKGPDFVRVTEAYKTEMRIIEEVRAGKPIAEAFRDANLRVDKINHELRLLPLQYEFSADEMLETVSDDQFEAWVEQIHEQDAVIKAMAKSQEVEESHLSFVKLIPMPEEIANESWHLVGKHWLDSEWGCKWVDAVREPPTVQTGAGVSDNHIFADIANSGETVAVFPNFVTPNSPVFPGLRNMSRKFPELLFLGGFIDPDCSEYQYYAAKAGEELAQGNIEEEELSGEFFETDDMDEDEDEPRRYVIDSAVLKHLTEKAFFESENPLHSPAP